MKFSIQNAKIIITASLALATYFPSNSAYGFSLKPIDNKYEKLKRFSEYNDPNESILFGSLQPIPKLILENGKADIKERYGCSKCEFYTQYQADDIKWPVLEYFWTIKLMPTQQNFDRVVKGAKSIVSYNENYAKVHEEFHANSAKNLFDKILGKVVEWAKTYTAGWFNSMNRANDSWNKDFNENSVQALKEFKESSNKMHNDYHEANYVDKFGKTQGKRGEAKLEYVLVDINPNEYVANIEDIDISWRHDTTKFIEQYEPKFQLQTSKGDDPIECPAPLPLLGLGVAFRYSRKLRNKLRSCN